MSKWDDTLEPPVEGFQALKTRIQNRETQKRQLKLTLLAVAFVVGFFFPPELKWKSQPNIQEPAINAMKKELTQFLKPTPSLLIQETESYVFYLAGEPDPIRDER